jgi:hypothetical protein
MLQKLHRQLNVTNDWERTMKFFLLATLIVLLAPLNEVLAHPATGIVVDRGKRIFQ